MMKLQFEPNLDFQRQAIDAVTGVFKGQEILTSEFSVTAHDGRQFGLLAQKGIGNRLTRLDDELLDNIRAVQLKNGLAQTTTLSPDDLNITVEMETGTGKTYVYLRTVFELNRLYGFTKFIIVVPSIAVREGVYKTLQITQEHFRSLYAGVPVRSFVYDSAKLGDVRDFAISADIRIMVTTIAAIVRKENIFYQQREDLGDDRPVDLIQGTRPIVIVDEPQSVEGEKGFEALKKLKPLCMLRYSATHRNAYDMVYRLDPVDAYEKKLVKRIEIAGLTSEDTQNKPYLRFLKTKQEDGTVKAIVEVDVLGRRDVKRSKKTVGDGDDLQETTGRVLYENHRIGTIKAGTTDKPGELLEVKLPGVEAVWLKPGQTLGGVDFVHLQRAMVRRTIDEHLRKERILNPRGIKVLSLFFVEHVSDYRLYDSDTAQKGPLALVFEEEWKKAASSAEHRDLFTGTTTGLVLDVDVGKLHDGYFSQDKQGRLIDTAENNQAGREAAERAYDLIMKDKEKLLSKSEPLRFIFSHSALREGWDNPNVFQICVLRDIGSEGKRRQTIGRGLRLCVDQHGARVRDEGVNVLTVVANEGYEKFAKELQSEMEQETGVRFGVVEAHDFAHLPVIDPEHPQDTTAVLGAEKSRELWEFLHAEEYVDTHGKVQEKLRFALQHDQHFLPETFLPLRAAIVGVLTRRARTLEIKDANATRVSIATRQRVLQDDAFLALWERIKHKTQYRVQFDNEKLLQSCITALKKAPPVPRARIRTEVADVNIDRGGVGTAKTEAISREITEHDLPIPDVLTELEKSTRLTRKSLARILIDSGRLDELRANPSRFLTQAGEVIDGCKRSAIVDGIKYERIGDAQYFVQELFADDELKAHLDGCVPAEKSVHEHVKCDSQVERTFVDDLEKNPAIKLYAKLPAKFQIQTPLGSYNPDWAIVVNRDDGSEQLYFVIETKGTIFGHDLRDRERAKLECGQKHFDALADGKSNPARFAWGKKLDEVLSAATATAAAHEPSP